VSDNAPAKYRSKCRIFADILRAIKESEQGKVTHLLHKANLSYDRLIYYLGELERSGLINKTADKDRSIYSITVKGEKFLAEFAKVEEFGDTFGVEI
jgi:predicted transcriptional regulator